MLLPATIACSARHFCCYVPFLFPSSRGFRGFRFTTPPPCHPVSTVPSNRDAKGALAMLQCLRESKTVVPDKQSFTLAIQVLTVMLLVRCVSIELVVLRVMLLSPIIVGTAYRS